MDEADFEPLFDGRSLQGWTGAVDGFVIEEGIVRSLPDILGNLETEAEFADFVLRFDVLLTSGANNGIGLRLPRGGHAATEGMEIQILDNTAPRYAGIQPYQRHGSLYGVMPARPGFLKPVGEWNSQEIRCIGRHVAVVLNGVVVTDADLDESIPLDGKPHPGLQRSSGHLGLLAHRSEVRFRNLRICPLPSRSSELR